MDLRLTVGGDPEGGWLVDIHDGDRNEVYRPAANCKTAAHAAMAALVEHEGEIPDLAPASPTDAGADDSDHAHEAPKPAVDDAAAVVADET